MKHPEHPTDRPSDHETLSAMMDGEWRSDVRGKVVDVCRDESLRACWGRYHLARDAMHAEAIDVHGAVAARISAAIAEEPAYSNVTAIGAVPDAVPSGDALSAGDGARGAATASSAGAAGALSGESPDAPPIGAAPEGTARGATVRTFAAGFGLAASVALVTAVGLDAWRGGAGEAGSPTTGADVASTAATAGGAPAPLGEGLSFATAPAAGDGARAPLSAAAGGAPASNALDAFSRQLPGAPLPEVELVANTGAFWSAPDSSARRAASEERLNMFLSRHIESSPTAERQGMLPYSRLVGYDERAPRER